MEHSHNTTHIFGVCSFLHRYPCPGMKSGAPSEVYFKSISDKYSFHKKISTFTSPKFLLSQHVFAPLGLMRIESPRAMIGQTGRIVGGFLYPPQSNNRVTKTVAEKTPYPELHSSRFNRGHVAKIKSKFDISTRVGLWSASRVFNH